MLIRASYTFDFKNKFFLNNSASLRKFWNILSDSDSNQASKIESINLVPNPEATIIAI